MGRQMTDASKSGAHRCAAPVQYAQDEDAPRQGSAHTPGGDSFHPFLVGLHSSPSSMETGGHLGRCWFDLQLQNGCDRSEDGLASMVARLALLFGQPARSLRQSGDPSGRDGVGLRVCFPGLFHLSISSSKGKRVKSSCPLSVITRSHSSRTVCSSNGWPAKVSTAKYMLGLISAGYFRE